MRLVIEGHDFAYEMECIVRVFYPGAKIDVVRGMPTGEPEDTVLVRAAVVDGGFCLTAAVHGEDFAKESSMSIGEEVPPSAWERLLGVLLFELLCEKTNTRPPWGILTGVRPVRFARSMQAKGMEKEQILAVLTEQYLVVPQKAELVWETAQREELILRGNTPEDFSLYISIPFCPSRCVYCSFVSHEIGKRLKLMPDYIRLLCRELAETAAYAKQCHLRLRTVYIGGGTPTTLEAADLQRIMQAVQEHFDGSGLREYTVEAGRPDTITAEKLRGIKQGGAGRISINPQTMNDAVLAQIGRRHTAQQVRESYALARSIGFESINMDLIAGLPGDTDESFADTLTQVLALAPENITVHALTVKRAAHLREQENAYDKPEMDIAACVEMARQRLRDAGYSPYYMYRQKGTKENLENIGYTRPGHEGHYNVLIMEEEQTILAVGAGAVTKICRPPDTIRRVYNFKYPYEYISRFDEILQRKEAIADVLNRKE